MVITESYPSPITTTIAISTSLAPVINLDGRVLVGIIMPAAWTAANLTFNVSVDNVTFNDLYDGSGVEINVNANANRFIRLNPADWISIQYLKVRSGTSAVPVLQAAARALVLVTKAV